MTKHPVSTRILLLLASLVVLIGLSCALDGCWGRVVADVASDSGAVALDAATVALAKAQADTAAAHQKELAAESTAQRTADIASDSYQEAQARVALLQGELMAAEVNAARLGKAAAAAQEAARLAPIRTLLHVVEVICIILMIGGIAEIIVTLVWSALAFARGVGEILAVAGFVILILCVATDHALDHVKTLLASACSAIALGGYFALHRGVSLAKLAIQNQATLTTALATLKDLGHDVEACAIATRHDLALATQGLDTWAKKIALRLHLVKAPTVPAVALSPALAPTAQEIADAALALAGKAMASSPAAATTSSGT